MYFNKNASKQLSIIKKNVSKALTVLGDRVFNILTKSAFVMREHCGALTFKCSISNDNILRRKQIVTHT